MVLDADLVASDVGSFFMCVSSIEMSLKIYGIIHGIVLFFYRKHYGLTVNLQGLHIRPGRVLLMSMYIGSAYFKGGRLR